MSANTSIEWTDATWNPTTGCDKVSPGCKHCYAEVMAARLKAMGQHNYRNGFELTLQPRMLDVPLRRRKPTTYFVNSMSDLFHDRVPFEFIAAVFGVMAAAPQHAFQVLTKRPGRMREFFAWVAREGEDFVTNMLGCLQSMMGWHVGGAPDGERVDNPAYAEAVERVMDAEDWPLPNVWLGVSVENRKHGLPRIDVLREVPAAVRFLSVEPLLEDLGDIDLRGIDWVIVGGESGHGARPMHPDWVWRIHDQVLALRKPCGFCNGLGGVVDALQPQLGLVHKCFQCDGRGFTGDSPALFFKQWGEYGPTGERGGHLVHRVFHDRTEWINKAPTWMSKGDEVVGMSGKLLRIGADFVPEEFPAAIVRRVGKAAAGRELDGRTWDEMPEVQR
jgi:protein gp37